MNNILPANFSVKIIPTHTEVTADKNNQQAIQEIKKGSITYTSEISPRSQRCKRGALNGLTSRDSFLRRLLLGGILEFVPILRHINPQGAAYNRLFPAAPPPAASQSAPQASSTTIKANSSAFPLPPPITSTRNPFAQETISLVKEMNSNAVAIIAQSERVTQINRMVEIAIQQRNSQRLNDYLAELISRGSDIFRLSHQLTYLRCQLQQRLNQLTRSVEQHALINTLNDLLNQTRVSLGQINDLSTRVAQIRQSILHALTICNNGSRFKQRSQ
mgnify:CR=1 FL=1